MKSPLLFCWLLLFAGACSNQPPGNPTVAAKPVITDTAQWIIRQAIARHGGAVLDSSEVAFVFRERAYVAQRHGQQFAYQRSYTTEAGERIQDILTNTAFKRQLNGVPAQLNAKDSLSAANSLNSVMYFAFLPYFLNDPAVQLTYHGITTAFGAPHYELQVAFKAAGGGVDFEDEYAYWIHATDFTLDYLAYNFLVNGGGARFRQAYNAREVGGIRFQDYVNFKPTTDTRAVLSFDSLFQAGGLDTLSLIELEEVEVRTLK
ncbi:MAG: hypothetical protein DA408_09235 [Bacteroidetes bacterium]|nr:MAG: hypothetical protein C7N36_01880 [Bacteroidota bacterium]PTM12780.1 MAG: hypothetical protein DA408_09235 [Bacteroidota bacterium]